MKKFLAIILGVLICLSVSMFTACNSTTFDGKYQETSATTISSFSEQVDESGNEDLDYASGIKTFMDLEIGADGQTMHTKNTMYFSLKDGEIAMQGNVSVKAKALGFSISTTAKIYYSDGYLYYNGKAMGITAKYKQAMNIEELIGQYGSGNGLSQIKLSDALIEYNSDTTKFYIETGDDITKIKIDYQAEGIKMKMYFIFNESYILQAFKIDMQSSFDGTTIKGTIYAEQWDGEVTLPSNLDSYADEMPAL